MKVGRGVLKYFPYTFLFGFSIYYLAGKSFFHMGKQLLLPYRKRITCTALVASFFSIGIEEVDFFPICESSRLIICSQRRIRGCYFAKSTIYFYSVYFILLSIKKKEGNHMEPQLRIMICRLAEKIRKNKKYADEAGGRF